MADEKNTPFAVRMEQDDKEKLLQFIQESGRSNKDFMNVLLSAYEMNKVKVEIPEATENIRKVEELTQLINDYFVNMSKQIKTTKESMNLQFTKETEIYKNRIEVLKADNEKQTSTVGTLTDVYNNACSDIEELKKELDTKDNLTKQLQESIKDKTTLVEEYKEKNDMILSQLKKFEKYPEQLEENKKLLDASEKRENEKNNEINLISNNLIKANIENDKDIEELNKKIKKLEADHAAAIELVKEKAEMQKDKLILELRQEEQAKIQKIQEDNNNKINEYQAKYKSLLEELEHSKAEKTNAKNKVIQK